MLTAYITAAMRRAAYRFLDDGTYYGEFPGLQGVYGNASSLEACREELQSALEDWILFGLVNGFPIPEIDGVTLTAAKVA